MTALVAAPSVSGARPASVKQFVASLSGGAAGPLTVTITNCGGPVPLPDDCTASSTIALGAVQIAVPSQPTSFSARTPSGTIWNATYNDVTKTIDVIAPGGSNKLNPGQSLLVTFNVPTTCDGTTKVFTTKAWGSNSISGTDPFEIKSSQPSLTCAVSGTQTETITGDFQGTLTITFGGNLDCSFDPTFGTQWSDFHLPNQVNITPNPDFVAGDDPKISTSRFPRSIDMDDSSSYLICYGVPMADHGTFVTRGGVNATAKDLDGDGTNDTWVGILPNCYDPVSGLTRPEPCVSEQFLDLVTNEIVISVRMPPGDPFKK
jgi:hypothetical protein